MQYAATHVKHTFDKNLNVMTAANLKKKRLIVKCQVQ